MNVMDNYETEGRIKTETNNLRLDSKPIIRNR